MSDRTAILLAIALLAANAFFVGAEFALISARRTAIEPRVAAGSRRARTTLGAMENVSLMMAGAQLGITICSLGLGAVAEPAVAHFVERPFLAWGVPDAYVHPAAFVIALSVVVFLHVVAGEMVPKNLALAGPDGAALLLAPPLTWVVRVLKPLIIVLNMIANLSLRAVGVQPKNEVTSAFTRDEVAGLVQHSRQEGLLDQAEHDLLSDVLTFDVQDASSVLLPLAELVTVAPGVTHGDVERLAAATGYSRFPLRGDDGDLRGYLHLKDVLEVDPTRQEEPIPSKRVRPLPHVSARDSLFDVLAALQAERAHLGRVTDPEGRVIGVVSLEDVLEELVGEIRDDTRRHQR